MIRHILFGHQDSKRYLIRNQPQQTAGAPCSADLLEPSGSIVAAFLSENPSFWTTERQDNLLSQTLLRLVPNQKKIWGRASVYDGETLSIGDSKIRLYGIKAPDITQTCREKILDFQFDAGGFALSRLKTWTQNDKAVICYTEEKLPLQGTCFIWGLVGPVNIAARVK